MRLKLAAAWVGLQLLFFVGWTGLEHQRVTSGESILVKVVPVDPRDLLRGQYLRLAYTFSRPWDSTAAQVPAPNDAPVWVVLKPEEQFHVPVRLSLERPVTLGPGEVALRGRARYGGFIFGVEQYFVPEGTETPPVRDLAVRLRVTASGTAQIEQVYVQGRPWP